MSLLPLLLHLNGKREVQKGVPVRGKAHMYIVENLRFRLSKAQDFFIVKVLKQPESDGSL